MVDFKKLELSFVFYFVLLLLLVVSGFAYFRFEYSKRIIEEKSFEIHIQRASYTANEIKTYFLSKLPNYTYEKLENNYELQKELESYLKKFTSNIHKNIFILEKPSETSISFRVIASDNEFDEYYFDSVYEPSSENWKKVWQEKDSVYFKIGVSGIWFTYQEPIIVDNKLIAIISLDFSVENYNYVKDNIDIIDSAIVDYMYSLFFIILSLVVLSTINIKREKQKKSLLNKLKQKTYELNHLNENLEDTVKLRTKELEKKKDQMKSYINTIDKYVITSTTNKKGVIVDVSQAFCEISGYTKNELIGKTHNIVRDKSFPSQIYKELWTCIKNGKKWEGELRNKTKDNKLYWIKANITPIYNKKGKIKGYTRIAQNITDHKKIEELSITDGLTSIYNRRHFNDVFPKMVNISKRDNNILCLMIIDIDNFKLYNDTYGHHQGDEALISVANTINKSIKRADDYCFRLGGEEFGILCKINYKENILTLANTLRKDIEALKITHEKNIPYKILTISIGLIALDAKEIIDEESMYKKADEYLYDAKNSGRNKVVSNIE